MNWEAIGAIGEILGGIIIIVSVLYLARQIKQSNRFAIEQSGFKQVTENNGSIELILASPENVQLFVKLQTGEELSPQEEVRADFLAERLINNWLITAISEQQDTLDKLFYAEQVSDAKRYFTNYPGLRKYFLEVLKYYPQISEFGLFKEIIKEARRTS